MATKPKPAPARSKPANPARPSVEGLTQDRDQYREWWRQGGEENRRLRKRIEELENAMNAIRLVADAAHGSTRFEDEIPF